MLDRDCRREVFAETVERARRLVPYVGVHRSCPEAAGAIDFAVVETILRRLAGEFGQQVPSLRLRPEERQAPLQCRDQATAAAWRDRSHKFGRRERREWLAGRVAVDPVAEDVDIVEAGLSRRPHGPFADAGPGWRDTGEGEFGWLYLVGLAGAIDHGAVTS